MKNDSGIEIKKVYGPHDLPAPAPPPGSAPFTRGIQEDMYRGKHWTMRQYAGFSTAEESNKRYRFLLEQGVTGLSVAFDLPTQIGYDSDDPLAEGEVGKVGVA
jgi:methylmalonyl-CoA mutase, N-terminal domain